MLAAFTIPQLHSVLRPLHWIRVHGSQVDLQDTISFKHLAIAKTSSHSLILTFLPHVHNPPKNTLFPVFGTARKRQSNPKLQAAATSFIDNILSNHSKDLFLWSDGSFRRYHKHAAAATLVTHHNNILHSAAEKLNASDIALAEICGIIMNLHWLLQTKPSFTDVHILCDNQYAIKVCLKLNQPNIKHIMFFQCIEKLINHLSPAYNIHFHWIPGHTDNHIHKHVDYLASKCSRDHTLRVLPIATFLSTHTDADASGGANAP